MRNYFRALFRSGVDADKIREYREKLQQSMRVFGVGVLPSHMIGPALMHHLPQLQSDIILRETVAKLASRQNEMMNELQNRVQPVPSIPSKSENTKRLQTVNPRIKVEPMTVPESPEMMLGETTNTVMTDSVLKAGNVAVIGIICVGIISLYVRFIRGE